MKKYEIEANENNILNSLVDDYLENHEYLSSLIRLISNIDDNEVICIDGEWGTGKTFLVKQLMYILKHYKEQEIQEKLKVVRLEKDILINICDNNLVFYYDAWKNDEHNDPLGSIIYNILNDYPEYKGEITNKFDKEGAIEVVVNILMRILSNKFLNIDLNTERLSKIKTFSDLSEEINTQEERKQLFESLINIILDDKRMILIIDELDRCNPKFATKLLEVVKHFCNLNNITIIIASNNNELQCTIKQQYGLEFNAYSYLNKFYDYVMTIDNNRSIKYSKKYLNFTKNTYLPHDVFYAMVNKYKFTLRDCNRYRVLYDTAVDYIENTDKRSLLFDSRQNSCIYCIILPIIFAFKIKDIDAYNECINGQTKKLKEALGYLSNYFAKNNNREWLFHYTSIDKEYEEATDDEIIEDISCTYEKFFNWDEVNKLFLNAIRISL